MNAAQSFYVFGFVCACALSAKGVNDLADVRSQRAVELPAFVVADDSGWLYARSPEFEVLSLADDTATRRWFTEFQREVGLARLLFPDGFLPKPSVPALAIVHGGRYPPRTSANWAGVILTDRVDYDLATFVINIEWFGSHQVQITDDVGYSLPSVTRYTLWLLDCRKPRPPSWLSYGIGALFDWKVFCAGGVLLPNMTPARTMADDEKRRLVERNIRLQDATGGNPLLRNNAVLVAPELDVGAMLEEWKGFGSNIPSVPKNVQESAKLFVLWGLLDRDNTERFWTFVRRTSEEKLTEALFKDCFGFGYAEANEKVRAAYRRLLTSEKRLAVALADASLKEPVVEIRPPRSVEIVRILGEWRRLTAQTFSDSAARSAALGTALDGLMRLRPELGADPAYCATLGLCEMDAGHREKAYASLLKATEGGAVRPKANLQLARLEFDREVSGLQGRAKLGSRQTRNLLAILNAARAQAPELAGVYELMCDVWQRSEVLPSREDLAVLEHGTRLFVMDAKLIRSVALLHANAGLANEADAIARRLTRTTGMPAAEANAYR